MRVTRRDFALLLASTVLVSRSRADMPHRSPATLILAPCNLGLRPLQEGVQPGTWRAPQVLMDAGLKKAVDASKVIALERPVYKFDAQPGTRMRNGNALRAFSLTLAGHVRDVVKAGGFPIVVGGDCSVLLGSLYGSRLAGGRGLVHIDGHSDFSHPGNYDSTKVLGSAAGMDLALVSGRGEPLVTEWPDVEGPLARDEDIVQIGERNAGTAVFQKYYGDIVRTAITRITVQEALKEGIDAIAQRAIARLDARNLTRAWAHVDLDVLDESVMPAVDSPGAPGFNYAQLSQLLCVLCASGRIVGANCTIYDPDLDPQTLYAGPLVQCIANGVRERKGPPGSG